MLTLLTLALALRATGTALRVAERPVPRSCGWALSILATWAAAGVAGAWVPLWTVLPVAATGAVLEWQTGDPRWIAGGDGLLLALVAVGATPPPAWPTFLVLAGGVAAGGGALEASVRSAPRSLRFATPILGGVLVLALGARLHETSDPLQPLSRIAPSLAIAPPCGGERVELESGAVAWYDRPRGSSSHPGAVVLHGADPRGSHQPAACSLRRALNTAGFATLALDHPGYGESPSPGRDASVDAWDPRVAEAEAVDALDERPEVDSVLMVAGHSMGGTGALRLLSVRPEIPLAFLFGVGVADRDDRGEYWYARFHEDRRLPAPLPRDRWRRIQETHYDFDAILDDLPTAGPRVIFVTFGWEWENVEATRERAFEAIPLPKERWHLAHASHYFSAFTWHGLVAGSGRVSRVVAHGIQGRVWEKEDTGVGSSPR